MCVAKVWRREIRHKETVKESKMKKGREGKKEERNIQKEMIEM